MRSRWMAHRGSRVRLCCPRSMRLHQTATSLWDFSTCSPLRRTIERKFMQGVARGLELAAKDRGLAYEIAQANNDAVR